MGDVEPFDIEEGGRMQKEKRCFEVIPKLCAGQFGMNLNKSSCGKSKTTGFAKIEADARSHCRRRGEHGCLILSLQVIVRCTNHFELSPPWPKDGAAVH